MRNVTIALDEEVARWVRVQAAENDTSVSRFVGDMLHGYMDNDHEYVRAMETFLARCPRALNASGTYPSRNALHERALLR